MAEATVAGAAAGRAGLTAHSALWLIASAAILCGSVCLLSAGLTLDLGSTPPLVLPALVFVLLAWAFRRLGRSFPTFHVLRLLTGTLQDFFFSAAQLTALAVVSALMIYLAANAGAQFPMRDNVLADLDSLLHFDWYAVSGWVDRRPVLADFLMRVYGTPLLQIFVVLLISSVLHTGQRNREFLLLFASSIFITTLVFTFVPAVGMLGKLDAEVVNRLIDIRAGSATMTFNRTSSIITFPSYHTVMAICVPYALRHWYWALVPAMLVNGIMLAAISPVGGHYLVDMLAGAGVALVSILIVRRCLAGCN